MKVLQILPSLNVGGVERGVIDLARAMKRRGEEAVVISSGGELVQELQRMGVRHYELPVHKKSLLSFALIPRIIEIINSERIDIVHARSRVPAWLAWLACYKTNRPFVTTCHGYYSHHPLSRVMGFGRRVIVISNAVGRHMIDDFNVSPERIRLVHRGVDLAQFNFRERTSAASKKPFKIINVGRLSPIKGQVEFLKAVHFLKRQHVPFEVSIVGSEGKGKFKYTELIQKTIRNLNLDSCVKLLGTRRDIPELLAQADLLVLSTLVPEAFGRVIIEAGAVGTPVLATRVGGVLDVIDHGENGWLVPPGDSKAMADGMQKILTEPETSEQFSRGLRKKVEEQFSLEKMIRETLDVYSEVKNEKRILVIKLGAMGDVILAVPSLRMLRSRFPEARISVLVDRKLAPLLAKCPYINEAIPVSRTRLSKLPYLLKTAKKLRREGFDISVDLQNNKWTHLLAFMSGVRERYGFSRGMFKGLLNRPDKTYEVADSPVRHQFRILSKLGVREYEEALELWSDSDAIQRVEALFASQGWPLQAKRVGFVLGSSPNWPSKRWPAPFFEELSRRLSQELGCRIVLIGGATDEELAKDFGNDSGVLNLIGKTNLGDLTALIEKLDVLVTGDTAPLHIAASMGTPVVGLFGPTDPRRHMPPAKNAAVLVKHIACQPCYQGRCGNSEFLACLKQISVEEVFRAVQKHLAIRETAAVQSFGNHP